MTDIDTLLSGTRPRDVVVVDDGQFLAAVRRDRIAEAGLDEAEVRALGQEEYSQWFRAVTTSDGLPHRALERAEAAALEGRGAARWYVGP